MKSPIINATVCLRRDNDYNFDAIKDRFVPASGEVILVDTARDGLRAKVGDGFSTYAQLEFVDEDLRNPVQQGYYIDGVFYREAVRHNVLPGVTNKIYIDKLESKIYYYNGNRYVSLSGSFNGATATSSTMGVMKLYPNTGYNTDGTMTQKAITEEFDLRYKATIDDDNELLIFSL